MNPSSEKLTTSSRRGTELGIVVQERDRRLLEELAVMRVADREQARIAAGFGSTTRINTRLLALTKAGLLRRFFLGVSAGNRKAVYALSKKGAAIIGTIPRGPRRPKNGLLAADFFVLHQLAINEIYCALKCAPEHSAISFIRWLSFHEPLTQNLRLIPDGYVEFKTQTGAIAAFLEVDLGHERLKVWTEKIRSYLQFALSKDFERRFGHDQFRVLVIANSERRLLSIRRVVRTATHKIFWFANTESISSKGLFAPLWLRPEGDDRQPLFPLIQNRS